jgi:hypothetical protein
MNNSPLELESFPKKVERIEQVLGEAKAQDLLENCLQRGKKVDS